MAEAEVAELQLRLRFPAKAALLEEASILFAADIRPVSIGGRRPPYGMTVHQWYCWCCSINCATAVGTNASIVFPIATCWRISVLLISTAGM